MSKTQTIIVPWDFSEHSQGALDYAIGNYCSDGIRVICVLERPNGYEMGWDEEDDQKAVENCVKDFFEEANHAHDTGLQFFTEFGDPSEEIVRFARKHEADLVIMSTHGRTGLKKLLMGSVSQNVIGKSQCPVIILPAKWGEPNSTKNPKRTAAV